MKKLLVLTVMLLTACCNISPQHTHHDAYNALWHSVVFIRGTMVGENLSPVNYTGSGVIVYHRNGYTYVLTAAHVGEPQAILEVEDESGNIYQVTEVIQHRTRDVALLKVKGIFGQAVSIWHGLRLNPSTRAWIVGYPVGIKIINDGRIIGYNDNFVLFSCGCAPGLSGGGLFIEHDGRWYLYGIVSRIPVVKIFQVPNGIWFMGMAEPYLYCQELLDYIIKR